VAAKEQQAHIELNRSRCELGKLEIHWKAVEQEANQDEPNIKKDAG
jgi:hypothetical protein